MHGATTKIKEDNNVQPMTRYQFIFTNNRWRLDIWLLHAMTFLLQAGCPTCWSYLHDNRRGCEGRGRATNRHKIKIGVYSFGSSFRMITRRTETKHDHNQLDHGCFPFHAIMH
jgi:hypothetical protein